MIGFSISALEKAPVKRSGSLPGEFLDLAADDQFQAAGNFEYDLTAQLVSGGVLVSGSISAPVSSSCGRCLNDVEFTLSVDDLQLFFEIPDGMEILEADEDLRAELLLQLPMNPLCAPDCRGLCPQCGANLNEKSCDCPQGNSAEKVSPWSALDSLNL